MHAIVSDHSADRRVASGHDLSSHDDVGHYAPVIDTEVAAGATDSADHLVVDHQDVVAVANLANLAEVLRRRRRHPEWPRDDRLGDERGDRLRALACDDMLEFIGASDFAGGI